MSNQLKKFWIILLLMVLLLVPVPIQAQSGSSPNLSLHPLSLEEARRAARKRMQIQVEMGYMPEWKGAVLGESVTMYDLSGHKSAFLFHVYREDEDAGYLTVAAFDVPNPVLEFSATALPPLHVRQVQAEEVARSKGQTLCTGRPIYVGPLSYGYELAPPGGCPDVQDASTRRLIDLFDGQIMDIDAEQARIPLAEQLTLSPKVETDSIAAPTAHKLISGVPDYCQFWGSYDCWSGCVPTASANILAYWDGRGYPNFQSGGDWQGLVNTLRTYMSTYCDGSAGSTNIGNSSPGMVQYAYDKGYYFESEIVWPNASYSLLHGEIDANRPLLVDLIGAAEYWGANHTVTGVGYQTDGTYMIVHDALACGNNQGNHYIHYGSSWYDSIGMHPTGPETTPPTINFTIPTQDRWYNTNPMV